MNETWQEHIEAGNEAFENGRYADAERMFGLAMEEAERFGDKDPRLALTLNNFAALCHSQGKYSMAEELYKRSLAIKEQILGPEHLDVAVNLHNLAVLYSAKRRFKEAEPLYLRSLEIRERVSGSEHPDLVPVLKNYALLLRRTGREPEAQSLERRIESILVRTDKPGDQSRA